MTPDGLVFSSEKREFLLCPMTEYQLTLKIREAIEEAGSLRALGKKWGVSAMYLCDLRLGRRTAGKKVLDALGLRRETWIISKVDAR